MDNFIYFIVTVMVIVLFNIVGSNDSITNKKEIIIEIQNYQVTIDSLISKNERLNNGFLELYDDRSMMSIEMDKLVRDNKYLKRITR